MDLRAALGAGGSAETRAGRGGEGAGAVYRPNWCLRGTWLETENSRPDPIPLRKGEATHVVQVDILTRIAAGGEVIHRTGKLET